MSLSKKVLALAAIPICLAACDGNPLKSKSPAEKFADAYGAYADSLRTAPTAADKVSPDAAVKAFWRLMSANETIQATQCPVAVNHAFVPYSSEFKDLSTPELASRMSAIRALDGCDNIVIERTIDEVKVESETRASVFATARQTAPTPTKFYDADSKKMFATGEKLKYVVEKVGGEWRVADAYHQDQFNHYEWTRFIHFTQREDTGFISLSLQY